MGNFCKFCGSSLEDGQACNCPKAVEERNTMQEQAAQAVNEPVQAPQEPAPQEPVQQQTPPQPQQIQPEAARVTEVSIPEPVTKAFDSFGTVLKDFVKDPSGSVLKAEIIPVGTSVIMLAAQVISFILFWTAFIKRTVGIELSFKLAVGIPFVAMLISWGVLYLATFVIGVIINQGKIKASGLFSVIAVCSIPWTAALLALTVISLIFGSLTGFTFAIVSIVLFATGVFTILLLERGLRTVFEKDMSRIILISIAVALQLGLTFLFINKSILGYVYEILDTIVSNSLSSFMW